VLDWLSAAGVVPPGNGVEAHIWDGSDEAAAAAAAAVPMTDAEEAAYHAKKLKMRKAMVGDDERDEGGRAATACLRLPALTHQLAPTLLLLLLPHTAQGESLHDDVDADAAAADRRLALLAAVSGDNWSSVVSEQTQATLAAAVAAGGGRLGGRQLGADAAAPHPQHVHGRSAVAPGDAPAGDASAGVDGGPVVSPFSKASVHRQVGEQHKAAAGGQVRGLLGPNDGGLGQRLWSSATARFC
jgi:hypothetical protein